MGQIKNIKLHIVTDIKNISETQQPSKMVKKKKNPDVSQSELMLITVTEIINELIAAHKRKENVDLNKLKNSISRKHGLSTQPRLVDIIAAVPPNHKETLIPKLKAKPV